MSSVVTDDGEARFRVLLTVLLVAIAAWGVVDLILDQPMPLLSFHVLFEAGFIILVLASTAYVWLRWARARRSLEQAESRLAEQEEERDQWRRRATKFLVGLGEEIDLQFTRWSLTPTEREVAMLLLKGYGHKESASLMARSERTVRQHAVAVYRKAGLSGRAELSAFFLEDLLLPNERLVAETRTGSQATEPR